MGPPKRRAGQRDTRAQPPALSAERAPSPALGLGPSLPPLPVALPSLCLSSSGLLGRMKLSQGCGRREGSGRPCGPQSPLQADPLSLFLVPGRAEAGLSQPGRLETGAACLSGRWETHQSRPLSLDLRPLRLCPAWRNTYLVRKQWGFQDLTQLWSVL